MLPKKGLFNLKHSRLQIPRQFQINNLLRQAGIACILTVSAAAYASVVYDYSYRFAANNQVHGLFTGTTHDNLITNLSNVSGVQNGHAVIGSGSNSSWSEVGTAPALGGGIVSINQVGNNFRTVINDRARKLLERFYVTWVDDENNFSLILNFVMVLDNQSYALGGFDASRWSVTQAQMRLHPTQYQNPLPLVWSDWPQWPASRPVPVPSKQ